MTPLERSRRLLKDLYPGVAMPDVMAVRLERALAGEFHKFGNERLEDAIRASENCSSWGGGDQARAAEITTAYKQAVEG